MKREDVTKVFEGATKEQIDAIMNLNGADIDRTKGDYAQLKTDLETANGTITTLTGELNTLKEGNASAEEWKQKFETLQNDITEKENAAKLEKEKAEREANILGRYNSVCVDKEGKPLEWSHDAIKSAYLQKFTEALSDETNTGKSDADIFHALTKDDSAAFKGITPEINLPGGKPIGGTDDEMAAAKAVMGIK